MSIPQKAAANPSPSHPCRWISWAPFPDLFATSCSGAAEKGRRDSASLGLVKVGGGGGWI
jgi:hypothetical protein